MKVVISESRKDELAIKQLDKAFSNLYEDVDYITDSNGEWRKIEYRNENGIIMIYNDSIQLLYFCDEVLKPIIVFSYSDIGSKNIIKKWFSNKFDLPVKIIRLVPKGLMN